MIFAVIGSILASFVSLMVYIYFDKNGQFEDSEEVKYQILREEE